MTRSSPDRRPRLSPPSLPSSTSRTNTILSSSASRPIFPANRPPAPILSPQTTPPHGPSSLAPTRPAPPPLLAVTPPSSPPCPRGRVCICPCLPYDLPDYLPLDSTASFRHHAYSPSRSVRLSRVQSSFSQRSRSNSESRAQSRSGSSASSPRLQVRGRTLPQDDSLPPDLRLDHQHRRSPNKRSSPALPDPQNHISGPLQIDSVPPPADPPYYRRPIPPLQDMPPRYTHNFVAPYALPPQFPLNHVPGHTSPPYIHPHSGQVTPPYPHYPPYPAYMYGHPSLFWGDIPPSHSHNYFQNQLPFPSNHIHASEHAVPYKMEFGSVSSAITTESGASKHPAQGQNGWQPRPSRSVVFGTIDLAESQDDSTAPPANEEQRTDTEVEHTTDQFATFSIGVSPDEPGPSRLASRKSSVRSLSRTLSSQPTTNDGAKDANIPPPSSQGVNESKKPIKWEFGTTLSDDLDDPRPSPSPSPTSFPPLNHQNESGAENSDDHRDLVDIPSSHDTSRADRSMDKSETESPASDVWVVKDYGYGFGDHSGRGNAPDVVRLEMRERERERAREGHRDREMIRDQYRERSWDTARQPGWRHENGVEEGREGWEQLAHIDTPRYMRPRRGSFPGYGGHERGGFAARRGRGFRGRFHGGRGRGGFLHHQRPGSYPYATPPPPPHPPFEVLPPAIDTVNGYGQPPYASPELEPYDIVPPAPQPRIPFTSATYSVDAMQNCLLGQLEYYLSPQNMAQDFYLRQRVSPVSLDNAPFPSFDVFRVSLQMDNEGWIPISLLASFKRVRQLHTDADIVREVLSQSGMVEVSGDWVRMGGRQWEVFVLPNAPKSVVTGVVHEGKSTGPGPYDDEDDAYAEFGEIDGEHGETEGDCDGEDCEGDDEDDDIEFVIGEEAEGSWMPVPERKQ